MASDTAKGCGCLAVILLVILGIIGSCFSSDDTSGPATNHGDPCVTSSYPVTGKQDLKKETVCYDSRTGEYYHP